jgi:hypothetical protein
MLKSLDILIGFSGIMLLLSVAVAVLTQFLTGSLEWRARHLVKGIITILNQIDPKMSPFCARQIAKAVLRHPLVARDGRKLGTVIQREELTQILLELAAEIEPGRKALDEYARSTLKRALGASGVANPAEVLGQIHLSGLEGASRFVGRIHATFDATMDRVKQRFARRARLVTLSMAVLVAGGLQLDAFSLLRRLSEAPDSRAYAIVPENWKQEWNVAKVPGIAFSAMLLSLGAPFWYNAVKDVAGLRPVLARRKQAADAGRGLTGNDYIRAGAKDRPGPDHP